MGVVGPDDRPLTDTEYEGIQARTVIDPDTGAGAITLGELVLEPGAALPLHRHRVEEAFYVFEGRGTLLLGGQAHPIGPGDGFLAPAWTVHGLRNDTDTRLRMTFVYPAVEPSTEFV